MVLRQYLIAVCGTTGVGKSRFAIDMALRLPCGAKIINADAMQAYEGTDILTNKVPHSERKGVEHRLMSFKKPGEQYIVGEWVKDAIREIDRTHAEGKIPIVVGGTSYWIQHLLFLGSLPSREDQDHPATVGLPPSPQLEHILGTLPEDLLLLYRELPTVSPSAKADPNQAFALHQLLARLDPVIASRWHWKDTRKVLRNLEIIKEHGRPASDVVTEEGLVSPVARYNALVFWLYSSPEVLNPRLDSRVDEMLQQGLLDELRSMHETGHALESVDFTLGVYQAIGYKEFSSLITSTSDVSDAAQLVATEAMKHNTRKYAQRQVKWIRNKLLPAVKACNAARRSRDDDSTDIHTYLLDATDVEMSWEENVMSPAKNIISTFLLDTPTPDPPSISALARDMLEAPCRPVNPADIIASRRKLICDICTTNLDRPVMIEYGPQWEAHIRSRGHRRLAQRNTANNTNDGNTYTRPAGKSHNRSQIV